MANERCDAVRAGIRRWASVALVVLLAGCTASAPSPAPVGSVGAPTVAIVTPPPLEAPCVPSGSTLALVAAGIAYRPSCLAGMANRPLLLRFDNQDATISHNVHVFAGPRGYATNPPSLYEGKRAVGPRLVISTIRSLPAGLLSFHCDFHPDTMQGLFAVAPSVSPASGAVGGHFVVSWATASDAPPGYMFDVQVRTPGSPAFRNWLTRQTAYGATFVPDAPGAYAFRVSVYPASGELRPIGYSPPASIRVG